MIRVMQVGLGDVGRNSLRAVMAQGSLFKIVGSVDSNPVVAGKSLGELLGVADLNKLTVEGSIEAALKRTKKVDVAILTTSSTIDGVAATILSLVKAGIHVVSSCEELAYPWLNENDEAKKIDAAARRAKVAVLATGVNPGFAMDAFALSCTAPCTTVKSIKVIRSLDASKRRLALQKKVGAGLTLAAAKKLIKSGQLGHVGLTESVAMIAAGLGWKLQEINEQFDPVVADHAFASEFIDVKPGMVRGMWMRAEGIVGGKKLIELDLMMAFDADVFDEVIIEGEPNLLVRTKSGFPGEGSTVGMLVNSAHCLPALEPGLRTMLDVLRVRSVGV